MSNDQSPEKEVYRAPAFADFKPETLRTRRYARKTGAFKGTRFS